MDNFESYENIKRFFIQLKRDNSKLSLADFNNAWENEGRRLFNLSQLESMSVLKEISQTADAEEMKKRMLEIDIDLIITQNYSGKKRSLTTLLI